MTDVASEIGSLFVADIWNPIKNFFQHGVQVLVGDLQTEAQSVLGDLTNAETQAQAALTSAQAKVTSTINPVVDGFLKAGAGALEAASPTLAPLVAAGEPLAETEANAVLDAFASAAITRLAGLMSSAGKSSIAVTLSNLAGATTA